MKNSKSWNRCHGRSGGEFQPVWLIANDPQISIVCKGVTTLTYFAKETTSVATPTNFTE
ncbi:MAG TPA: hypothetical protein VMJ12_14940 [Candidatus Acidoferrales bacterium]|nr:hypothetical protein [Candidatus Acidoferrales bacterium]